MNINGITKARCIGLLTDHYREVVRIPAYTVTGIFVSDVWKRKLLTSGQKETPTASRLMGRCHDDEAEREIGHLNLPVKAS